MSTVARYLDRCVDRIERAAVLDKVAETVSAAARKLIRPGPIEDTLSGTQLGHPAHPLLVAVPIGAWTSAAFLDAVGADEQTTRRLIGIGVAGAVPSALTGASDWLSTAGAERRIGLVHAAANDVSLGLQAASWVMRRRGHRRGATWVSAAAVAVLGVGGWLGGHLAYAMGVGVDTTAFQHLPTDWTDVAALDDLGARPIGVEVDGVPIVLYRTEGSVVALAARCTHRGAPLQDGTVDAQGCITCPWHGSTFAPDGSVRTGPATRPQPELQARTVAGRVEVRRDEPRTLRTNPVGR